MINSAFRLLLAFNATSLLLIIYLVQQKHSLTYFFPDVHWLTKFPEIVSYLIYFLAPLFLTGLSIFLSTQLGQDEFKKGKVESIEYANNSFLPSYLGYFFVALSIQGWTALWFVYAVLLVFTFLSQALYFNPLFLLFGYEFYNLKTTNGVVIFLISRNRYKAPSEIDIAKAYRINDYTFIEKG